MTPEITLVLWDPGCTCAMPEDPKMSASMRNGMLSWLGCLWALSLPLCSMCSGSHLMLLRKVFLKWNAHCWLGAPISSRTVTTSMHSSRVNLSFARHPQWPSSYLESCHVTRCYTSRQKDLHGAWPNLHLSTIVWGDCAGRLSRSANL